MNTIKKHAVIFDFDGLIAESEPLAMWAWQQVLGRYGHTVEEEVFSKVLGMRVIDSAEVFLEHYPVPISAEQAYTERNEAFLEAVPDRLEARPGLYDLLDRLEEMDVPKAVATSGNRDYLTAALPALDIEERFSAVATGDEVEHGKPAPDIFLLAAKRLGAFPADCLALEDAPRGVKAAVNAGMACIAVPNRWSAGMTFPGAREVLPSLHAVRDRIDEWVAAPQPDDTITYEAAGCVVVHEGKVLVLRRPSRGEVRLPKGHIQPDEDERQAALRETTEESGYAQLKVEASLGTQMVEFDYHDRHVAREEHYFLATLQTDDRRPTMAPEGQFNPIWVPWEVALKDLTFEAEREWVRRAQKEWNDTRKEP